MPGAPIETPPQTLPDLLRSGLDIVFVGINPSIFSVQRGHYFARKTNRFWPCLSRSTLSRRARQALSVEQLGPEHDTALLDHGIGFTDLVKRATAKASDLAPSELAAGVQHLLAKLEQYRPRVTCFHGITGYRPVHRMLTGAATDPGLGLQDLRLGPTRVYLVPNPSGANAHFTPADQTRWYDRLAEWLEEPMELSGHR
jgi:TDG/mug DNA glycosylase family protein